MANGNPVSQGSVACPQSLEIGRSVEIGGKRYICTDRMAKQYRKGNYFDIWDKDCNVCKKFGRQKIKIKIWDVLD